MIISCDSKHWLLITKAIIFRGDIYDNNTQLNNHLQITRYLGHGSVAAVSESGFTGTTVYESLRCILTLKKRRMSANN